MPLRTTLALALVAFATAAFAQEAAPPAAAPTTKQAEPQDPNEATAAKLKKPIKAQFKEATLGDAFDAIAAQCDIDLVVDWPALEKAEVASKDKLVTLDLRRPYTAEVILSLLYRVGGGSMEHQIENGIVIVTATAQPQPGEPERPAMVTRVYDVDGLIVKADGAEPLKVQIGGIMSLIQETVQRELWRDNGGIGSMAIFRNKLVIRTTEGAHTEIAQLLLEIKDK